jgi:hypothetical protein
MMRAFSTPLLAALLLAAAVAPAAAAPAAKARPAVAPAVGAQNPVTSDVRCLLAMLAYANLSKENPQAAQFGVYFFVGRINARAPGLDLTSAVKAQAPTMGAEQLQAALKRCGPIVNTAGQGFQAAVNSLRPPGAPAPAASAAARPAPTPTPVPSATTPPK